MELKNIVFSKGMYRSPSLPSDEGELSECVNLIPEGGELVNLKPATALADFPDLGSMSLLTTHLVDDDKHYIFYAEDSHHLTWISDKDKQTIHTIEETITKPQQVVCLGKSIVLLTDEGMTYLIWKDTLYKVYNGLPEINVDFDLDLQFKTLRFNQALELGKFLPEQVTEWETLYTLSFKQDKQRYDITDQVSLRPGSTYLFRSTHNAYLYVTTSSGTEKYDLLTSRGPVEIKWATNVRSIEIESQMGFTPRPGYDVPEGTLRVLGIKDMEYTYFHNTVENLNALNGSAKYFIDAYVRQKHKFVFPFFIRYGLKMYNGEVVHVSSPILMVPNWGNIPMVRVTQPLPTDAKDNEGFMLDAAVDAYIADIKYTITKGMEKLQEWSDIITGITFAVSSPIYKYNQGAEWNASQSHVKVYPDERYLYSKELYAINASGKHTYEEELVALRDSYNFRVFLPEFDDAAFKKNIVNKSTFYIIKEMNQSEMQSSGIIDVSDIAIDAVETLPTLRDDYNSHNTFRPSAMFVYNNRLTIANIREQINEGIGVLSPLVSADESLKFKVVVDISFQGSMKRVVSQEYSGYSLNLLSWFYFPNVGVKSATVFMFDGTDYFKASLTPEVHPYLNGSYLYMPNGLSFVDSSQIEYHSQVPDNVVSIPNAVYQSSLNNPFSFPVLTQSQIGTGAIRAITTSAKALSSGTQFGQFPLYAFTSDGIWAVSLDEQGRYVSSSPVNRDIVTNTRSICQTDDAVIYACSEGLKILAGSDSQVLSNALAGNNVDESKFLLGLDECHQSLVKTDTNSFVNMLQNCSVLYDNAGHRHLHIYPDNCLSTGKHFILDLGSGEFSTFVGDSSKVSAIIPDYPFSLIQMADGSIGQFTNEEQNDILRHGIILTRPLSFENPFTLKVLADMRMIYSSVNEDLPAHCRVGVYVSNDSIHWKPLRSLHAHSYKWYRFRIQTSLTDMDALKMLTCLVEERQTNKIR